MACWPQLHAIDAFKCDVVLVLDSERLYAEMSDHYRRAASTIEVPLRGMAPPPGGSRGGARNRELRPGRAQVVRLSKSGGVVLRDSKARRDARGRMIRRFGRHLR